MIPINGSVTLGQADLGRPMSNTCDEESRFGASDFEGNRTSDFEGHSSLKRKIEGIQKSLSKNESSDTYDSKGLGSLQCLRH